MKKIIKLTERDLTKIIKRVILEQEEQNIKNEIQSIFDNLLDQNPKIKNALLELKDKLSKNPKRFEKFKNDMETLKSEIIDNAESASLSTEMNEGISDLYNRAVKSIKRFVNRNWTGLQMLFTGAGPIVFLIIEILTQLGYSGIKFGGATHQKIEIALIIEIIVSMIIFFVTPMNRSISPFSDEFEDEK